MEKQSKIEQTETKHELVRRIDLILNSQTSKISDEDKLALLEIKVRLEQSNGKLDKLEIFDLIKWFSRGITIADLVNKFINPDES